MSITNWLRVVAFTKQKTPNPSLNSTDAGKKVVFERGSKSNRNNAN